MASEGLGFAQLDGIYQQERRSAQLTKLPHDYFSALSGTIAELRDAYHHAQDENPGSAKVLMLGDELRKVTQLAGEIYAKRIRKVTLLALTHASGVTVDTKVLHPKEIEVYESLVAALTLGRESMLPPDGMSTSPRRTRPLLSAQSTTAPTKGPQSAAHRPSAVAAEQSEERMVVEALEDIGSFVAQHGETVRLHKDDVASVPASAAKVLLSRGLVRLITPAGGTPPSGSSA